MTADLACSALRSAMDRSVLSLYRLVRAMDRHGLLVRERRLKVVTTDVQGRVTFANAASSCRVTPGESTVLPAATSSPTSSSRCGSAPTPPPRPRRPG